MREYEAYHIHSYLTNLRVPDSVVSKKDYAKRFREIGNMHMLSTCEHGWQGDIYYANDVCEQFTQDGYPMRPVQVCEAYFVKDRHEKDATNAHIILMAVNNEGRRQMNYILSEAALTGFYHQPRIDFELLLSVNPADMLVTTACVGGVWKYEEGREYIRLLDMLRQHFGGNFYLEVQPHNTDKQKELNERIRALHMKGYQIIAGTDSHFVDQRSEQDRAYYLESKGMFYEDEQGWDLSLPTGDELYEKFLAQGVLSKAQIDAAIRNTLVVRRCNNPDEGTAYQFTKTKKIPNIHKELDANGRIRLCKRMMLDEYNRLYPDATDEQKARDFAELKHESRTIETLVDGVTPMADYFLTLSAIVKHGKERGGVVTTTGRGSATSFLTNHLLGMTSVNRVESPVRMYADRFISPDRIAAGTLAD